MCYHRENKADFQTLSQPNSMVGIDNIYYNNNATLHCINTWIVLLLPAEFSLVFVIFHFIIPNCCHFQTAYAAYTAKCPLQWISRGRAAGTTSSFNSKLLTY